MRKSKAFTLVEMLVVISIIALLVAMLLPALAKSREAAVLVKCLSRERQMGIALNQYATDNDNWLLPNDRGNPVGPDRTYDKLVMLADTGYMPPGIHLVCPDRVFGTRPHSIWGQTLSGYAYAWAEHPSGKLIGSKRWGRLDNQPSQRPVVACLTGWMYSGSLDASRRPHSNTHINLMRLDGSAATHGSFPSYPPSLWRNTSLHHDEFWQWARAQ